MTDSPKVRAGLFSRRTLVRLAVLGVAGLAALVLLELALRLLRDGDRFLVYHRNSVKVFYPTEELTPGITGTSYFSTNSIGMRGPELGDEPVRLVTIGGSTTACTVLDDPESWPWLLADRINERAGEAVLWVGNCGVDGHNSDHHLMHAKYLVPMVPELDFAIVYAGLNDLGRWLYQESFDPKFLDDPDNWATRLGQAFRVCNYTDAALPWYKHLEIWKRASIIKDRFLTWRTESAREAGEVLQDARLEWLETMREQRANAPKRFVHRAKLETLPVALDYYADNLRRIAELVRAAGVRPVFVLQAIQSQTMTPDERKRRWMGGMDGGKAYVKAEQMLELLGDYNDRMREVAAELEVPCIDLPSALGTEAGLYYDSVHFNELGAQRVGAAIAASLWPLIQSAR